MPPLHAPHAQTIMGICQRDPIANWNGPNDQTGMIWGRKKLSSNGLEPKVLNEYPQVHTDINKWLNK